MLRSRLVPLPLLLTLALTLGGPPMAAAQTASFPTAGYPVAANPASALSLPSRTAARLRALDADLAVLATRSSGRVVDGVLQIVGGAAFTTIGVFVDDTLFRTLLVLTGAVNVTRGVNQIALLPDAEAPAQRFVAMPADTADEVRAKVRFGEQALFALARRTRAARLIDGSLTMAGAATYVPLYWALRHRDDPGYRFGDDAVDYVGLALSTVAFSVGLIGVIIKSDAEQRAQSYRKLVDRFERERPGELDQLTFVPRLRLLAAPQRTVITVLWTY